MDPVEFFEGLARVYEAGAAKSRQWVYNNARQQDADVYEAMAEEARAVVRSIEGKHD